MITNLMLFHGRALCRAAAACLLCLLAPFALAVTEDQLFAWAAGAYPEVFPGVPAAGRYLQFNYRHFAATGNYVAVDSSGTVFVLGPVTGNVLKSYGPLAGFSDAIAAWEARDAGWPSAGNPAGQCAVPVEAQAEDVSRPSRVIGDGTAASCTGDAVVQAVARGGIITFNCGPDPIKIMLGQTAKIFNSTGPKIVIDGGGKVTLSGGGRHRILYMNTCDAAQGWTTSHCQDQDHPQLTLQNLTFVDGNAKAAGAYDGGGAVWVRGGRLKIVNSRFFRNQCDDTGPDVGGGAVRVFSQYQGLPVYVVNSTFGGSPALANVCSNGGALSSIGVSFSAFNSLFGHNQAIGYGANPARAGTPGGGSGGAIYNDGNSFQLKLCGSALHHNSAREGGGAIFFVSNDRSGTLEISQSELYSNPSAGFETRGFPGIFYLGKGSPVITGSRLQ